MTDYVTHRELEEALADVRADIDETEERLREEFIDSVRYEMGRVDEHLGEQDDSIKWILRTALMSLVLVICALIYLVH